MGRKKRTLAKPPRRMTRRERSRWQRERRIQRNFILVLVAIGVISILVLSYGLIHDLVVNPNRVIAKVNGEPVRQRDYWRSRRLEVFDQFSEVNRTYQLYQQYGITLTQEQQESFAQQEYEILYNLSQVHKQPIDEESLQNLFREVLIQQGAEELNISVTDEDVNLLLLPDPEEEDPSLEDTLPLTTTAVTDIPPGTLTPKERERQIEESLSLAYSSLASVAKEGYRLSSLGFSRGDYIEMQRHSARMSLLRERIRAHLAQDLPQTELQVRASHILVGVPRETRATEAEAALQKGDPFPLVVANYSDDETWQDQAGDLGWITRGDGTLSAELEEAAFALVEPGDHSAVVEDDAGYHILQLVERDEAGDQVHLQRILILSERRSVAEQALLLVQEGGLTFAEVAQAYSEDEATAPQGGSLDWVERGDGTLSPTVEEAAFALTEPEQISAIIEDEVGYHIVQLVAQDEENADRAQLRHILIFTGQDLAQEVYGRIEGNTLDFAMAVVEYSQDQPTVDQIGDRGWITRGDGTLSAELEEAAFALTEPGENSAVVEDDGGYHILQLIERDEAGDRVHLREILVKKAADLIEEIYDYIVEGDPETMGGRFFEMVIKYSDDTGTRANAGDLGWFGTGRMVLEFEKVAFNLEADEISDPVQTQFGYHIIWVQERDDNRPLDEEMLEQRAQEAFNEWLQELVENAVIERDALPTPTPLATAVPAVTEPSTETATP
jgi:parvulin-like peptidyl-prolyl isomerase